MTTFDEVVRDEVNKVYYDFEVGQYRCKVIRGPGCVNAYIGIKEGHQAYNVNYSNILLECHGGLTFCEMGSSKTVWNEGYYWIGWDYAHAGDATVYDRQIPFRNFYGRPDTGWTPEMVKAELEEVVKHMDDIIIEKEA